MRAAFNELLDLLRRARAHARLVEVGYLAGAIVTGLVLWRMIAPGTTLIHLVNGLPGPVNVSIDGAAPLAVPAGETSSRVIPVGLHRVTASTSEGRPIERRLIPVASDSRVVAYNVGGAAPLFHERLGYTSSTDREGARNESTFLGGVPVAQWERVDFVFTDPPKTIRIDSKSAASVEWRSHLGVAKGGHEGTMRYLVGTSQLEPAARLALSLARAFPSPGQLSIASQLVEKAWGRGASVPQVRSAEGAVSDASAYDGELSWALAHAGRYQALEEEAVRRDAEGSRALRYRYQAAGHDELARLVATALSRDPSDRWSRGMAARLAFLDQRWDDCLKELAALHDDPDADRYLDDEAECLVAKGRLREARRRVDERLAAHPPRLFEVAVVGAQLAYLDHDWVAWHERLRALLQADKELVKGADSMVLAVQAHAGHTLGASSLQLLDRAHVSVPVVSIESAAASQPGAAWTEVVGAPIEVLADLPLETATLLGAEFLRAGSRPVAEALLNADFGARLGVEEVAEYLASGREPRLLWRCDPEVQAAVVFVRSRRLQSEGRTAEAAALRKVALGKDRLHSVVTSAIGSWPAATPPRTPLVRLVR